MARGTRRPLHETARGDAPSPLRKVRNVMGLILIIVLILLLVGAAPRWPYSRGWGYYPSGLLGLILLIVLILLLLGRI
jgi:hypothetical protein